MKTLCLLLLIPHLAFGMNCKVDGISDSPQKVSCYIHMSTQIELLNLECRDGRYLIFWEAKLHDVDQAYHEEVERGSNPLVFQAHRLSLTTTSFQFYSNAKLTIDGKTYHGLCFNK